MFLIIVESQICPFLHPKWRILQRCVFVLVCADLTHRMFCWSYFQIRLTLLVMFTTIDKSCTHHLMLGSSYRTVLRFYDSMTAMQCVEKDLKTQSFILQPQATKGDSKNAKKKNNKKTSKNKSSLSRANKKKPGMPNVSNDLSQKLYATMEKHKEVFDSKNKILICFWPKQACINLDMHQVSFQI